MALSTEEVVALLSSDDLNVKSEKDVFRAIIDWLKHKDERIQDASRLLAVVRLPSITPQFLSDNVETNPLFRDQQCQELLNQAFKFYALPHRRDSMNLGDRAKPRRMRGGTMYVIGGSTDSTEGK